MRHVIGWVLMVGLAMGLTACKKPAEAAPAAKAPDVQTGTVERTAPEEQTGTVERTAPEEQTGTVERSAPVEQ